MRLDDLRIEFETLSRRYGLTPPPELTRILTVEQRRRYRMRHLQSVIEETQIELRILREEVEGLAKGLELALANAIDTARREHNEGWSPVPVIGYRLWSVTDEGIIGYRVKWTEPTLEAFCGHGAGEDEVPHTDGRCGPPACGIYAAKNPTELIDSLYDHDGEWLMGMVELSGKVVEHQRGYRAKRATVVAIVGFDSRGSYEATESADLVRLFDRPASRAGLRRAPRIDHKIRAEMFFESVDLPSERNQPWT